jgi:outer membrane protein assembly factor BamB
MIKRIFLVLGCIFLCHAVWMALLLVGTWVYVDLILRPPQPIAEGDFPASPVWVFEAPEQVVATPATDGGRVFIRTKESICAISAAQGDLFWCSPSPSDRALAISPVVWEHILIVAEEGSSLAAFDVETGQVLWRREATGEIESDPRLNPIHTLAAGKFLVYVARRDRELIAYNPRTGKIAWTEIIPDATNLYLDSDSQLLCISVGHYIRAFDPQSGGSLWIKTFENQTGPISIDRESLYFSLSFAQYVLQSLDVDTLKVNWGFASHKMAEDQLYSLVTYDDGLYVSGKRLFKMARGSGDIQWISEAYGRLRRPVVLGNRVFVRDNFRTLYALDRDTGRETGRLTVQANKAASTQPGHGPVVVQDLLIVPFGDERVFAYRP